MARVPGGQGGVRDKTAIAKVMPAICGDAALLREPPPQPVKPNRTAQPTPEQPAGGAGRSFN